MNELKMDRNNPCPFVQPYLVLIYGRADSDDKLVIDVDGKIEEYISDLAKLRDELKKAEEKAQDQQFIWLEINLIEEATPKLNEMIQELRKYGCPIWMVTTYAGSCGPDFVLRNGALFRRIGLDQLLLDEPKGSTFVPCIRRVIEVLNASPHRKIVIPIEGAIAPQHTTDI